MKTNIEKLETLKGNNTFLNELQNATTVDELRDVFTRYNVELTTEEVQEILDGAKQDDNVELSAEDLDNVAGGLIFFPVAKIIVAAAISYLFAKIASAGRRR